ncbi:MAG: DUF2809 domain-containing protein [Verrucomicrobiae bacterium]|nr:DUF2809 domain-containing protein [Verrucomicrobiae bacterium]
MCLCTQKEGLLVQGYPRPRGLYALLTIFVLAVGLVWRSAVLNLPEFVSKYGGDVLWSMFVFLVVALLLPRRTTTVGAVVARIVSAAVEFSQLYHAPWIDAVRASRIGALVLGTKFNPPDLIAYAVGICLGIATDGVILGIRSGRFRPNRV